MGPGLKDFGNGLCEWKRIFHSKISNSSTLDRRRTLWREISSLFLANMGHNKGLRWHKPALFHPHPRLLWINSLAGHCASCRGWCIFNEVTESLGQALCLTKFLKPDPGCPLNHCLPVPGCQAHFPCNHEPGLLENLQIQSTTDPEWGIGGGPGRGGGYHPCLPGGAWAERLQE